jgi:hypothetical protein
VKLTNGQIVLIEGKGRKEEKDDAKWTAAKRWVAAVNTWASSAPGRTMFASQPTRHERQSIPRRQTLPDVS